MAMLLDFKDITDAVMEELKVQTGDTVTQARIKRIINEVYIQEVVPFARWKWLEGNYAVKFPASYYAGTASVTPDSTTVTLSVAPNVALGSFAGRYFATTALSETYTITAHTAGSATITLNSPYLGGVNTTANFRIWTDRVNLPTDCRETVQVWHAMNSRPMEGVGLQQFRRYSLPAPLAEGYPRYYNTGDYEDPSTLTGELETDRYRVMRVYPAINSKPVTLYVDYVKEVAELTADGDEPVLPVEDRIVLKYGALAIAWRSIGRNPEEAELSKRDYEMKLRRMSGKIEDSQDKPALVPDSVYLKQRRAARYQTMRSDVTGGGGGGTYGSPQYLKNVTIEGGTLTAELVVNPGVLIDGVDISVLAADLAAHIANPVDAHDASAISVTPASLSSGATDVQAALVALDAGTLALTTVALADNTANQTVFSVAAATNTAIQVTYSVVRSAANIECGTIYVVNDGVNATAAVVGANLGTLGVTFDAVVSAGNVILRASTSSTGTAAQLKYRKQAWAA